MMTENERSEMKNVIELFRKGADACAKVNVKSGTAYISVRDISAIVECGDEVEIHMRSGTIFTMTEPPEKSHSRSQPRVTVDDWNKVLRSEDVKVFVEHVSSTAVDVTVHAEDGCEYVGMLRLWKDAQGNEVEE